jgi:AcrR family transcriptional regulator
MQELLNGGNMLRRIPSRNDGILTRKKIIKSAYKLFSKYNYNDVSVSKLCKDAGISIGAFYQYFKNKDSLFKYIINEIFNDLVKNIRAETLKELIFSYVNFVKNNPEKIIVIHEAEFIHSWVEDKFEKILMEFSKKYLKDRVEFVFFWGVVRFSSIYHILWKSEDVDVRELLKFLSKGLGKPEYEFSTDVFDFKYEPVNIDLDTTKMKLLITAEELFGKKGYTKTKISDITNSTKVAQGTFYLYFNSKKDILHELVKRTNKNLRLSIKLAVQNYQNRIDSELAGFYAFLKFFSHHINIYKIVRESEFIDKNIALEYYEKIKESYINPLENAIKKGEVINYNPENLAVFLMGLGHFLGKELLLGKNVNEANIIRFLMKISKYLKGGLGDNYEME